MKRQLISALALSAAISQAASAQTLTPDQLEQRSIERRAVGAAIWGMSAVNYDLMLQEMLTKTAGKVNQFIYWSRPLDWHNQTLTPNPDAIYFMAFFNTKEGSIVVEVPPADGDSSLNANFVDVWQIPLEDAGRYGIDKGAGVKFLILPPGSGDAVPVGYTPLRPATFGSYVLLRSNLASHRDADVAKSVAYQGLSALAGRQSLADHVHRRCGRGIRFHDPLRRELFCLARPYRAERIMAVPRPRDD
jgi:hypothetical protein